MTQKRNYRWPVLCIAVVLATMVLPVLGQGQTPPSNLINVVVVQVHNDMMVEFEALEKEANAAFKKAGLSSRKIWQVARGATNEYHIVTPADKYADFDGEVIGAKAMGEAGWARWVATVTKCVQSRSVYTLRALPKLTMPPREGGDSAFVVLTTRTHAPGMGTQYGELQENLIAPARKKAGVRGVEVYRAAFGGNSRAWVTAQQFDKWADLDGPSPLRKAMGEEAYNAMAGKAGGMTVAVERLVLRYRPELSF